MANPLGKELDPASLPMEDKNKPFGFVLLFDKYHMRKLPRTDRKKCCNPTVYWRKDGLLIKHTYTQDYIIEEIIEEKKKNILKRRQFL